MGIPMRRTTQPCIHPFPMWCISCFKRIGYYYPEYKELRYKGYEIDEILNKLDLNRSCCRTHFKQYLEIRTPSISLNNDI